MVAIKCRIFYIFMCVHACTHICVWLSIWKAKFWSLLFKHCKDYWDFDSFTKFLNSLLKVNNLSFKLSGHRDLIVSLENEGMTLLQKVRKHSSSNTVSHPRNQHHSGNKKTSHFFYFTLLTYFTV